MAYVSDDLKPMRPKKVSLINDDVVLEKYAYVRPSDEGHDAQHVETADNVHCPNCDTSDERALDDQYEELTSEVDSSYSVPQANSPVCATRPGDDDIRPSRPSEEVLKQRIKPAVQPGKPVPDASNSSEKHQYDAAGTSEDFGLLKLMVYACLAIVAIWLLGSFGTVLHNIAIAASILEILLFCLIFIIEVSLVWYVIHYAKKTFAGLPKITQIHRKEYSGALHTLAAKLKSDYIRQFPDQDQYAKLSGFNHGDAALCMLSRLRNHKYADSVGFMDEYDKFQLAQDKQALVIIKYYAKIIGIKTAASPWKGVDIIAVFFNSTLMVSKIAKVYHRQLSRQQAFRLVIHWFINLYISGELGQITEGTADAIAKGASEWLGEEGISAVLQPAVPLLAKFGGKIAEGGVNAYLAYRLGNRACEHFRELID
jgi:uncharacterized membrane protein YcjF (UPF0283 family)